MAACQGDCILFDGSLTYFPLLVQSLFTHRLVQWLARIALQLHHYHIVKLSLLDSLLCFTEAHLDLSSGFLDANFLLADPLLEFLTVSFVTAN